jgi:hypothetical protein
VGRGNRTLARAFLPVTLPTRCMCFTPSHRLSRLRLIPRFSHRWSASISLLRSGLSHHPFQDAPRPSATHDAYTPYEGRCVVLCHVGSLALRGGRGFSPSTHAALGLRAGLRYVSAIPFQVSHLAPYHAMLTPTVARMILRGIYCGAAVSIRWTGFAHAYGLVWWLPRLHHGYPPGI